MTRHSGNPTLDFRPCCRGGKRKTQERRPFFPGPFHRRPGRFQQLLRRRRPERLPQGLLLQQQQQQQPRR